MENLTDNINAGNDIDANEMKQVTGELENTILSSGITLSDGDLAQLAKAVADYAGRGDYYTDNGITEAFDLSPIGSMRYPETIVLGQRVRFIPKFSITTLSTSTTLAIASGTTAPVSTVRLDNGETPTISTSMWNTKVYSLVYTQTPDTLTKYWYVDSLVEEEDLQPNAVAGVALQSDSVTTSKILDSNVTTDKIANLNVTNAKLAADIQLDKISGGTLDFSEVELDGNSLEFNDGTASILISKSAITMADTGESSQVTTTQGRFGLVSDVYSKIGEKGLTFTGTNQPGNAVTDQRMFEYSGAGLATGWSSVDTHKYINSTVALTTTIPYSASTPVINAFLTYDNSTFKYTVPVSAVVTNNGGFVQFTALMGEFLVNPNTAGSSSGHLLHFWLEASNL